MTTILDGLIGALELIFGVPWVAPLIIAPAMLLWAAYLWFVAVCRTAPYLKAANARVAVISKALGESADPMADRAAFYCHYSGISQAMNHVR